MQIGQLDSLVSKLQSAGSDNLLSQTIQNSRGGNASVVTLRSGKELPPQSAPQQMLRPADVESESKADSPIQQQARPIPLSFPT
ncbi:hypothetical protein CR513_22641, partial [Mucuna pruriens]